MGKGHNFYGGLSAEHLKQFIERLERLDEEKKNISADMKEVFAEAKGAGFDTKVMRQILKIRKMDDTEREEFEYLIDTYKSALGMTPDLFDEDDNPAIKENEESEEEDDTVVRIKTSAGEVETDIKTLDKLASRGLKALKAVGDIKAFGDKVRKIAKENGMSEQNIHAVFVAKASEIQQKTKLPFDDVLAAMKGEDNA